MTLPTARAESSAAAAGKPAGEKHTSVFTNYRETMQQYRSKTNQYDIWDRSTGGTSKPSKLHIATQALFRLINEEQTYHKELQQQKARVEKLKAELPTVIVKDENAEYMIRQEERAIAETEAVFVPLHKRINEAMLNLKDVLSEADDPTPLEELENAKRALDLARVVLGLPPAGSEDFL